MFVLPVSANAALGGAQEHTYPTLTGKPLKREGYFLHVLLSYVSHLPKP